MTYKKDQKIDKILDLAQNSTSLNKVLASVRRLMVSGDNFTVFSANPEILLLALKDKKLASVLLSSDVLLTDGFGLSIASDFLAKRRYKNKLYSIIVYFFQGITSGIKLIFTKEKNLVKGRDLFLELTKIGNKLGWKIFLLGGKADEAEKTKEKLEVSLKKIKIGSSEGPLLNEHALPINRKEYQKEKEAIEEINSFKPDLLFVAFGAPKQELWISKNMPYLKTKGVMSVGGTFRYVSGKVSLPSKMFEKSGLEWLWRLISEPRRLVRIFNAVIIFPLKIYSYKLNS